MKSKDKNACKRIQINPHLTEFKRKANVLLHTEKASRLRKKKRGIDIETAFGDIKRNCGFTRFTLRGLDKVALEFRLIAAGHTICKLFYAKSMKRMKADSMK